ncbi:hypothetical protein [Streptomyces sp. NPDC093060]|uniref:hypothetical protein n=1 Tax=Streptomyces sp. NPDC093060 TaxID=3366019 RepID=UPI00381B13CD
MTTFTDDFNRADSTNLGANWVEVSGDWSIVSNQLSSGSAGGTIILRAAGAMATSDNSAQVTIAATAAVSHGVWCRGNSNISQGYLWRNDGTSWNLFSVVGGSFTSIGSFAGAAVAGDVAKVQAVGSTIKGFVNGIARVTVTDTNVTTGTSVGIRAESTNLLRFDDFTGADVTTGITGDAALSSTATLSAAGLRATSGSSVLAPTASLTADGTRSTAGAAGLATSASLTAAGQTAAVGNVTLTTTAALSANGQRSAQADASLTTTASLTTHGQVAYSSTSALTTTATLTADGATATPPGGAALSVTAALAAAGATAASSNSALDATATLTASGTTITTHDDIDVTVGAPYSPWTVGQPYASAWSVQVPQASDWEVDAPC